MNHEANAQLLDSRYVVVDSVARPVGRLGSPFSALVRAAAALWRRRALGLSVVPVDRVRATQAAPVEPAGQGAAVLRTLRRQALQAGCRAAQSQQGTGAGGSLHSEPRG